MGSPIPVIECGLIYSHPLLVPSRPSLRISVATTRSPGGADCPLLPIGDAALSRLCDSHVRGGEGEGEGEPEAGGRQAGRLLARPAPPRPGCGPKPNKRRMPLPPGHS